MAKHHPRAGLFSGYWTDLDGTRQRRIHRSEYAELYRLNSKHQDIRESTDPIRLARRTVAAQLGITPLGAIPVLREHHG